MKDLMSITSLRSSKLISILVFLMTIFYFMNSVVADDAHRKIIQDLPRKTDFDRYLSALEVVIDFCTRNKYYVDLNLHFGLFLIDVNLRQVLQQKRAFIPTDTRYRLEELLVKNDILNNYFHHKVKQYENVPALERLERMTRLFYNATTWSSPVDEFNLDMLMQTPVYTQEKLENIYGRWGNYYFSVISVQNNVPSPSESDACIASLGQPSSFIRLNRRSRPNCRTPTRCKEILQKGSDYGYGLTHRFLYMVLARFSGRCVVFSEKEDKSLTDMFCKMCFSEAEYIALYNFQLPDLMYEHVAICGIFGHAQFIRNHWLKTLLKFQMSEGCFTQKFVTGDFYKSQLRNDADQTWKFERSSMNQQCNGHFTAVAVGVLSSALRYIMETHY